MSDVSEYKYPIFMAADIFPFLDQNETGGRGNYTRFLNRIATSKLSAQVMFDGKTDILSAIYLILVVAQPSWKELMNLIS